jgi:hypothetical protein
VDRSGQIGGLSVTPGNAGRINKMSLKEEGGRDPGVGLRCRLAVEGGGTSRTSEAVRSYVAVEASAGLGADVPRPGNRIGEVPAM